MAKIAINHEKHTLLLRKMGQRIFPVGEASEKLATIDAPEGQQALSPGQAKQCPGYYAHILGSRPARAKASIELIARS